MEEKDQEARGHGDLEKGKGIESYIDASFMLLSTMVNDRYEELEEKIKQFPGQVMSPINKNIVESSHRLYVNICNENFKKHEELKRKIIFRLNILIGICGVVLILGIIHLIK